MKKDYDVIVIGAGHAGIEAAYSAVRAGGRAAMVTLSLDKIGEMSCNPAIGGLAKGQIVCEIDALGGLMGEAIDATGLQFRILNRSKGPAVWGPRAQADKRRYAHFARAFLENLPGLELVQGEAVEILTDSTGKVAGVKLADDQILSARGVVVTSGTFLNGIIHIGEKSFPAGRFGEPPARGLTDSFRRLGLRIGRLKTGTCPRLLAGGIDFDRCERQMGDDPPVPFSMLTDRIGREPVPCYLTYTNSQTHQIIRDNLDRAPLYTGQIQSTGPRYCPSLEVKIVRFQGKERHQVYLEPESLESDWIYCNGLATSIPEDLQEAVVHSIAGLERAKIIQYGYAIEYDYVPPDQLGPDLQCRGTPGLFFAGQINGTSGYEEAAGQGLLAGVNALRYVRSLDPIILSRDQAYIGVMIDDLVTRGVDEPYRMFTSRAEFRLLLRADTAERRLCPLAHAAGLLDDRRRQRHHEWETQRHKILSLLQSLTIGDVTAEEWLRRPENDWEHLPAALQTLHLQTSPDRKGAGDFPPPSPDPFAQFAPRLCRQVQSDIKYSGYQRRERQAAEKLGKLQAVKLPPTLDYDAIPHLKKETREKLKTIKPHTLAQASRVSGITPADILVIMIFLKKTNSM